MLRSQISRKSAVLNAADYINFEVLDYPEVEITEIAHPDSVVFKQVFDFEFLLDKVSSSAAKNVRINVHRNDALDTWDMETLSTDRRFVIEMDGRALYEGKNNFRIGLS